MTRWAIAGSHISTRLRPSAPPTAFNDSWQLTGTMATAWLAVGGDEQGLEDLIGIEAEHRGRLEAEVAHGRVVLVLVHAEGHAGGLQGDDGWGHGSIQASPGTLT